MPPSPRHQRLDRRRHRFYGSLLLVTLLVMASYSLPAGWRLASWLGHPLLTLMLLVEIGGAVGWGHRARHPMDRLYQLLGIACLVAQLIWLRTPLNAPFGGVPLLLLFGLFISWSLKRLVECLAHERWVGGQVVAGALAGYLLLGISGGLLLSVLATLDPPGFVNHLQGGSQVLPEIGASLKSREAWLVDFIAINYFAFVSLTTVGFGGILPVTPATQMGSIGLAVAGPLYIAVVMGVLISRLTNQEPPASGRERDP